MKILVDRKGKKDTYTIGRLYVDNVYFCNTLEDKDRGLKQTDKLENIKQIKVPSETAIPTGTYNITLKTKSQKYSNVKFFKDLCDGYMPRLENVPGFEGILIHTGNTALDSSGCLLVGLNTAKGKLTQSKETFKQLYKKMKVASDKGEKIIIEIK